MSINKKYITAGMLATAFVVPLSDVKDSHASEIRITTARVHFRTGAGTNYSSMGVLDTGVKVSYISESGNWTKVQYNSKTGYICSDYLKKESSTSTTTNTMYVTASAGLNLRKGPSTSYAVIKTLSKGTEVTVVSSSNGWSKVNVGGVSGYVSSDYLSSTKPSTGSSSSNESTSNSTSTMYTTDRLNLRKGAGTSYSVITTLDKGIAVTVHSSSNGWSKVSVNGMTGYVSSSYLSSTKPSNSSSSTDSSTSSKVDKVLNFASQQLGKPYVWGAQGPNSFDCSGLTYYVYKNAAGITLPRTSVEQSKYGTTVSKSNLKAGDLIFFDTSGPNDGGVSHVGIYVGNGQMIHASSSQKKIVKVSVETSYWNNAFVRAKRVL